MFLEDLPYIFSWWSIIFLLGAIFFPLSNRLFASFIDRGYIFAKILGILVFSYLVWVLGIIRLLPFSKNSLFFLLLILVLINFLFVFKNRRIGHLSDLGYLGYLKKDFSLLKWLLFEELLFFACLLFWSFVKAHQPDIQGLEKFMDFGFINSILRAKYFPPLDMWLASSAVEGLSQSPIYNGGYFINYYYFGHLVTAVLTKLTGINPAITFNLMLATIFAFCFTGSFSLGINLFSVCHSRSNRESINKQVCFLRNNYYIDSRLRGNDKIGIIAGLLTGYLVTLAGNLHTIYAFFKPYVPFDKPIPFWQLPLQNNFASYWYPNATRFIPFTIHEFPSYSFVVSDLHGHVLDVPFVLLTIALLLSYVLQKTNFTPETQNAKVKIQNYKSKFKIEKIFNFLHSLLTFDFLFPNGIREASFLIFLGFLLTIMYMTNAWDGIIYFGLSALVFLYTILCHSESFDFARDKLRRGIFLNNPLCRRSLHSPAKGGFGRDDIIGGVIQTTKYLIFLLLLFAVFSLPFQLHFKPFVFGIGIVRDYSPLWTLVILWGFFYFCVLGFLVILFHRHSGETRLAGRLQNHSFLDSGRASLARMTKSLSSSDIFILLMILLSTALLIFPELFYIKDIYPLHYRANTMFKLGYQAFIMLSLASGYIITKIFSSLLHRIPYTVYRILLILLLSLVSLYPYFSINSYFGNLKTYQGLYGLSYLNKLYPDDYQAILWLNKNVTGQPVILEAVGDSYTDYARVSANTGLPTVLGWPVHEWLWRGSYDEAGKRVEEVKKAYMTNNLDETKVFLKKYAVQFVFVGQLERQKYPKLNEAKFAKLGKIVYQSGETTIYKITY